MITALTAFLGGDAALPWVMAILGIGGFIAGMVAVSYHSGRNSGRLADQRAQSLADAARIKAQAAAWQAETAVPGDPTVPLRKHDV